MFGWSVDQKMIPHPHPMLPNIVGKAALMMEPSHFGRCPSLPAPQSNLVKIL